MAKEASYYEKRADGSVQCRLCPNDCHITDGHKGVCSIRSNRNGVLWADAYGEVVSLNIDPVEKKPLYHFHPGKQILSTGPNGCNFRCGFCQNSEISQGTIPTRHMEPEDLVRMASANGSIGIAYTYTEPFVWFEFVRDTGRLVHDRGLVNVLVTNGYVCEEPLREILPLIDAMNVDVKSINPAFYQKVCGGKLEDVLRTVEIAAAAHCHIEVTNLIIPGYNDTDDDFSRLTDWLAGVNPSIPLHFSRYFPRYRFTAPPTPPETIRRACETARKKLRYVYSGNIDIPGASDTVCPSCGNPMIRRTNYDIDKSGIRGDACSSCGNTAEVVSS